MRCHSTGHAQAPVQRRRGRGRRASVLFALLVFVGCKPGAPDAMGPGGSASFSVAWKAPTTSADGTALEDLASYRLYYSTDSALDRSTATEVDLGDSTHCTVRGIAPGTYFVAVSAVDQRGNESDLSNTIRIDVVGP